MHFLITIILLVIRQMRNIC